METMVRLFKSTDSLRQWTIALLLTGFAGFANAVPPVVTDPIVADVTDRSFSVIWTTDQAGQARLQVFTDMAGTSPVTNAAVSFYPVNTGNPAVDAENREASRNDIVQAAQSMGIVKATVSGLSPDTAYYVKYGFENDAAESTLCPDAGATGCPGQGTLLEVQTTLASIRTFGDAPQQMFINDVLLLLDPQVALGELLIVAVENAQYPLSVFAGDGASLPLHLIDLNNLYQQNQSFRVSGAYSSGMGNHGEALVIRRYRGQSGNETQVQRMGPASGQGATSQSVAIQYGDCNGDGRIDGYDLLQMDHFLAGDFTETDFSAVAFHPVFCNLLTEEGLHSLATRVNIDQADSDRLQGLLIGTINSGSLPQQP